MTAHIGKRPWRGQPLARWAALGAAGAACLAVMNAGGAPASARPAGPVDLWLLAASAEAAVVVDEAAHLATHLRPALDLVGFSLPAWASAQAGVVSGQDGRLRVIDQEDLTRAGIPADRPLALLRFPLAPATVLAFPASATADCDQVGTALGGGAPPGAQAWWAGARVCLVVVGECRTHGCSPVGLKKPAALDRSRHEVAAWLRQRTGGVRLVGSARVVEELAGRAADPLLGLGTVAVSLRVSAPSWRMEALVHSSVSVPLTALRPLQGVLVVEEPKAAVEVGFSPNPEAWKTLQPGVERVGGAFLRRTLGPDWWRTLAAAPLQSVTVSMLGVDTSLTPTADGSDRFHLFYGALRAASAREPAAAALAERWTTAVTAQGYQDDSGVWVKGERRLAVAREGGVASLLTGPAAERGLPLHRTPVQAPEALAQARVRVRGSGQRLKAVLTSGGLLHAAAHSDVRLARAAAELMAPTLERVGAFTVFLEPPARAGAPWRLWGEASVGADTH